MASQRNNITLPEVQMLLQRTIMNESQSILGKLDNLGATINDLKEDARAAKEENMSLKEELSSLKNKINMIYPFVGNDLSVSSPPFAGEATGSVEKNGLFSDNLYPLRSITKETLKAPTHFVWETYHKLAERVIGRDFYQTSLPLVLDPSLENPIVEGPLLERAEDEAATKAIQRKRGRPSTKKKTKGIQT
ncbi:hypothetical protein HPULCUR_009726 [Helicostylum pulchrum]|uniref:Uncharacterized protein n=1 Tax=Helicostylum pulchrum TaxID=562976 RepID=A0ABP9YBA7_9FUNG